MPITAVKNSPIGWVDPAEEAWTQCENTYSQAWVDGETLRFQVISGKIGQNLLSAPFDPFVTGTTTADGTSSLPDSGASFLSEGILSDHLVVNATAGEQTLVDTVISDAVISLDDDIFGSGTSGDSYEIIALRGLTGNITYQTSGNELAFAPNASTNSVVIEDAFESPASRYVVEVDIEDYAGGRLRIEAGTFAGAFDDLGANEAGTATGTWSFYGFPSGADLRIIDSSNESDYTIADIRIYETSQVKWYLTDSEFTTSYDDGTPGSSTYQHDRCTVTITPSVADGEYAIQIEDRLLTVMGGYIKNYEFDSNDTFGWVLTNTGTGWDISSNQLNHTSGGGVGTNYAEIELRKTTSAGCNYRIEADVTGDAPTVHGKAADGSYTLIGTLSTTLTFTSGAYTHLRISLTEVDSTVVDNITLQPIQACPDLESHPICINETLDASFIKFTGRIASQRAATFVLGRRVPATTPYTETMYIGSNIRFGRWDDPEGEQYRDSEGNNTIVFSDRVRIYECQIAPAPAWVHAWLTWALRTSTFKANDTEFYASELGGYSPNWDKRTRNAPVVFDIVEQGESLQKTLCT